MKSRTWLLLACFSCLPYIQSCTDDLPAPTLPHICGNGVVEPGETCDDYNTDSGDGCSGKCQVETGWVCQNEGKPCTKPGDPANDAICGDGELSDGEDCDDANTTSGDGCSDTCRIEPDWECKTPGEPCTKSDPAGPGNDDICGDGKLGDYEDCDDGNLTNGDGCSKDCNIEEGWECPANAECIKIQDEPQAACGDKSLSNDEECDDGNTNDGDGCSKNCTIEEGWKCETPGKQCTELPKTPICGDKIISENETCDDGNVINGDGCSDKCQIEEGWTCTSSGCTQLPPPNVCGDSKITGDEKCDDGNTKNGDGCSDKCQIESGWECDDKGCHKIQTAACGDSKLSAGEECDDGNTKNGDGCSSKCVIEDGYACPTAGTACKIEYDSKTSIKILGIGNSFMRDATCYLTDILLDMGYKNVTVGVLYSGGRSINDHADNIRKGNTALKYFYNVNGTEKNSNNPVYIDKIKSEAWDYVVLQQYPSGVVDLYNEDLDYVIKTIQNNATSKPKIMWAMTWAFQNGSPHTHLYYHGHNQMKMYEMTVNAIQSKILTNKNIAEVIPAGTAVQNMRSGIMGDNMNRDGYHMSMNTGRFVTALTWAKQITKRPISGVTFTPAGHAYADMKLSLKYTKRQIDAIKEAVLNAYKHPYEVTVPAKGVDADYSALKKPLHDIFKNNKYDLSKYRELKFGATEQAYYNPTTRYAGICTLASAKPAVSENGTDVKYCYSTMVTAENGGTSATLKKYAATRIFNRHEIPNGSVIVMKDGYQYIPDGWTDLKEMTPSEKRPKTVKTQIVEVNDAWWGNFNYRAFSIAKAGAPELTDKEMAELPGAITIFVPTHLDNTDNAEDVFVKKGYDMSKYTKLDLGVAFKAYYNSNTASDLPGLVYGTIKASHKFPAKLFDGNATAKKYAATKIFKKSEIPNGSVIVAVKGYQYYQDGWSELDVPNLNGTRPAVVQAKDSDSIVTVNDAWWGKFKYRGFDIGRVKSPDEPTPLEQSMLADKFAIFVPKK